MFGVDAFSRQTSESALDQEIAMLRSISAELQAVSAVTSFAQGWIKEIHEDLEWGNYEQSCEIRRLFKVALTDIYRQLFTPTSSSSVLEIGSGKLNEQQESYLSQLFPTVASWTFSDVDKKAEQQQSLTSKKYIALDLTHPCPQALVGSFDYVVGCNVLDTLPYVDLKKAFKTISQLLKPGSGQFIHFADLNFYYDAFIDVCAHFDQETVLFPPAKLNERGVYRISKHDYERILKERKNDLSNEEQNFLIEWGNQGPALQAVMIREIAINCLSVVQLAQRIQPLFSSVLESIVCSELFQDYLKKAVSENNLKEQLCKYVTARYKRQREQTDNYNCLYLQEGCVYGVQDNNVPSDKVMVYANLHVYIAHHEAKPNPY